MDDFPNVEDPQVRIRLLEAVKMMTYDVFMLESKILESRVALIDLYIQKEQEKLAEKESFCEPIVNR